MIKIHDTLARFVNDEVKIMFNKNVAFVLGAVFAFGLVQGGCCMKNEENSNESERKVTFANPIVTNDNENSNQTVSYQHRRQPSSTDLSEIDVKDANGGIGKKADTPSNRRRRAKRPIQRTISNSMAVRSLNFNITKKKDFDDKTIDIEQAAIPENK